MVRDYAHVADELTALGVAASRVQNSVESVDDPQLEHLGYLIEVEHPTLGTTITEALE
jgi:crotonobetainyl-CoA:carnitine CoA-transferase CaiB-like acyl-CoA transferase